MSESMDPVSREPIEPAPAAAGAAYAAPGAAFVAAADIGPSSPVLKIGGGLGIAASVIGLAVLIAGCAGFPKAMYLGVVVTILAGAGLITALVGAWTQKHLIAEDTHVLQALFANVIGIVGGVLEMALAFNWAIFYK
jgi:hypothetical protein